MINQKPDNESLQFIIERCSEVTCQFFKTQKDFTSAPRSHGSGILFAWNSKYYCFSEANIIADLHFEKSLVINKKGEKIIIQGKFFYANIPRDRRNIVPPYDLAVIELYAITVSELKEKGYSFLYLSEIETKHVLEQKNEIFITGSSAVPLKYIATTGESLIKVDPYLKDLVEASFPNTFYYTVQYASRKISRTNIQQMKTTTTPHVAIGKGLWAIKKESYDEYSAVLIGICSEVVTRTSFFGKAYLRSIKIGLFLDLLRRTFDPTMSDYGLHVGDIDNCSYQFFLNSYLSGIN